MRRPSRWSGWTEERAATTYSGAVVVGFLAVTLGPSLIGLRTLISVNILTAYYPWRVTGGQTIGHEGCSGDTIDAVMPSIAFIRNEWVHGHLGAWQGVIAGGSPMGALPDWSLLSPLSLPYFVLPLWLAPAFVKLLEFLVAGGGTYLFLRRLGVSRSSGMISGLVFCTSGFMVMWSNWPQTQVGAMIPPLFWAAERLVQRMRTGDAALVAVFVAWLLLSGFPSVAVWGLELAGLYFLVRMVVEYGRERRLLIRGVLLGISGVVTGGLLAMIQFYPFVKALPIVQVQSRSGRGLTPVPAIHLVTLVAPNAYGLCVGGKPTYGGGSPIETVTFIGVAALLLAVVGACVGRRAVPIERVRVGGSLTGSTARRESPGVTAFLAVAAATIALIGWSTSSLLRVLAPIPPFGTNPVGRISSILGFALATLAGFGLDALVRRRPDPDPVGERQHRGASWRRWMRPAAVVLAFLVVAVVLLFKVRNAAVLLGYWLLLKPTLTIPALLTLATVVVIVLAATGRRIGRWLAIVAVPLLVVGQSGFFFHQVLPGDDPGNFYRQTEVHKFLQAHLGEQRFDASSNVLYPSTALYYRLRTATGHSSQSVRWIDLLHAADPRVSLSPTFTAFSAGMSPSVVGASPILDRLGIEYWAFTPNLIEGIRTPLPSATSSKIVSAGGSCEMPGGAIRGVTVRLAEPLALADAGKPAIISVLSRNGDTTVTSSRVIPAGIPAGRDFDIAIPGEDFSPTAATSLSISLAGAAGPVRLASSASGELACAPIRPAADHLRLVFANAGAIVYRRLNAMERIRWAGSATVIPGSAQQVAALAAGMPGNTVVLDRAGASGSGSGAGAVLAVESDNKAGSVTVEVRAAGAGYLTVADAMTAPGWTVRVDGHRAALLIGDHALGTVAVPAGRHTVSFRYDPPGFRIGAAATGLGLLCLVALVVLQRRRRLPVPWARRR